MLNNFKNYQLTGKIIPEEFIEKFVVERPDTSMPFK